MTVNQSIDPVELHRLLPAIDGDMADEVKESSRTHPPSITELTEVAAPPVLQGALDPVYESKARLLNDAIQEIGMGWYQWQLFVVVGFGWASDNLWPIVTSLILPPINKEFHPSKLPLLSLSQNIGLLFGAMFWGFGCDLFGRRLAFNMTIGITSVFGLISASSPSFAAIGVFAALWSVGVGGNLPVGKTPHPLLTTFPGNGAENLRADRTTPIR